ncbi:MAG: hypothetical protein ACRD63_03855 [Pyrinomonadaceae bacterium]
MVQEQQSVADIFRHAQSLRRGNSNLGYKELRKRLAEEYAGSPFPPTYNLTIPEQDGRAPQEDWSAGLSIVLRGIQRRNWQEIADGIVLSLEQTETYERERSSVSGDTWHDRTVGIKDPLQKGVDKWLPEELMDLAKKESDR